MKSSKRKTRSDRLPQVRLRVFPDILPNLLRGLKAFACLEPGQPVVEIIDLPAFFGIIGRFGYGIRWAEIVISTILASWCCACDAELDND